MLNVGPWILCGKLKIMGNEKCTLENLEYGEEKLKNVENGECSL